MQAVETALGGFDGGTIALALAGGYRVKQGFHGMGKIAYRGHACHACAAFERVQVSLQGGDVVGLLRIGTPGSQCAVGVVEDFPPFLDKHFEQVRIDIRIRRHPALCRSRPRRRLLRSGMFCLVDIFRR